MAVTGDPVISVYGPPDVDERYTRYPTTVLEVLAVQLSATECWTVVTPVPESVTVNGELVALLVTTTLAEAVLAVVGVNVTVSVAVCPAATTCPAVSPDTTNPEPGADTAEIVTLEFPLFVSVTFCALLLPTATLG